MIRNIVIKTSTGTATVSAFVAGQWAAHESRTAAGWDITHEPTGCSLGHLASDLTRRDARRIVSALAEAATSVTLVSCKARPDCAAYTFDPETKGIVEAVVARELAR